MTTTIVLEASDSGFAENKDDAKRIRTRQILPTLDKGGLIVLDFSKVTFATQSYIHALIGESLVKYKQGALEKIEFKNCSPQLKSLISLVVNYSLGGFGDTQELAS